MPKLFSYCKQVFVYHQVKYSSKIMLLPGNDLLLTRGILFEKLFEWECVCLFVCVHTCVRVLFSLWVSFINATCTVMHWVHQSLN